jgi:hypothetical protein
MMNQLKTDIHQFPDVLNDRTEGYLALLHSGKSAEALLIKCSLLNENPTILQKSVSTGELLMLQSISGIIPSYFEEGFLAEKATLAGC